MSVDELARQVRALLARSTVEDVKARVEIGALLAGHGRELKAIAEQVGLGPRALRHCVEVRRRFGDDELTGYFSLARVPPWSALVAIVGVTSMARRTRLLDRWAADPRATVSVLINQKTPIKLDR